MKPAEISLSCLPDPGKGYQLMAIRISNKPTTSVPTSSWAGALWHQGTYNPQITAPPTKNPTLGLVIV